VIPDADYYVTVFMKIMKVSDDIDAWAKYEAGGAFDAGWGNYIDGVLMYVGFQDIVGVYQRPESWTGSGTAIANYNLIATYNLAITSPKGLGKPIF
jgi:hypothetical protein